MLSSSLELSRVLGKTLREIEELDMEEFTYQLAYLSIKPPLDPWLALHLIMCNQEAAGGAEKIPEYLKRFPFLASPEDHENEAKKNEIMSQIHRFGFDVKQKAQQENHATT